MSSRLPGTWQSPCALCCCIMAWPCVTTASPGAPAPTSLSSQRSRALWRHGRCEENLGNLQGCRRPSSCSQPPPLSKHMHLQGLLPGTLWKDEHQLIWWGRRQKPGLPLLPHPSKVTHKVLLSKQVLQKTGERGKQWVGYQCHALGLLGM